MFNGNISETYWRTGSDNTLRKYGYGYDQLNRMTSAVYQKPLGSVPVTNSYNETVSYDKNGNITSLKRNGMMDSQTTTVQIDDLSYAYPTSSNLLMKVHDRSNSQEGFADDIDDIDDATDDYAYDTNGNMIRDSNKKITSITYNHLNLPVTITFDIPGTNTISYTYDATGLKKSKLAIVDGAIESKTDYISGFQYLSGVLQFFPTAEGYVKKTGKHYNYVFTYKDHLGNTRLSYGMDPGGLSVLHILEENNNYPFGLKHQNYNSVKLDFREGMNGIELSATINQLYQYKYNGKELQQEFNLNWYDYQARNYDPAIGRWMNIDPLSEQMRRWSPYNYCFNNPMRFIDPDGMAADDVVDAESEMGGKKNDVKDLEVDIGYGRMVSGGNNSYSITTSGFDLATENNSKIVDEMYQTSIQKELEKRFIVGDDGKPLLNPHGKPKFTDVGIAEINSSVEGLQDAYKAGNNPQVTFDELTDVGSTTFGNVKINPNKINTNLQYAAVLFHEYRHSWQYASGYFYLWMKKFPANAYVRGYWNVMERDAYWYQIKMGAGSFYEGYSRYDYYRSLAKNLIIPYQKQ